MVSGAILIADAGNGVIRSVNRNGIISTIAGSGKLGFAGDGKQARMSQLNWPRDAVMDKHGTLYIADTENNRVRCVSPKGFINTIAGTGRERSDGDGKSARLASVQSPYGLAIGEDGTLYVAEANHVRAIDNTGKIRTVAGGGADIRPDGKPATRAIFALLSSICLDKDGSLLIADGPRGIVYSVDRKGIIRIVISKPQGMIYPPQRGDTSSNVLVSPTGVTVSVKDRTIYVADSWGSRVLGITP